MNKPYIGEIAVNHPMNNISYDTKVEMVESGKEIALALAKKLTPSGNVYVHSNEA